MGSHNVNMDEAGREVITLSGVFGLEDASSLAQTLADALKRPAEDILLSVDGVEQGGAPFFQLLFALCRQARLDGKRVTLAHPLSTGLSRQAEQLGISKQDFDAHFTSEAI